MKIELSQKKGLVLLYAFLAVFFGLLYRDYFIYDPVLKRDDQLLVKPLTSVSSLGDYIELLANNIITDVQPVRDLSLLLDIQWQRLTGIPSFHAVNFLLFFLILFLFQRLLRTLQFSFQAQIVSLSILAAHPLMVSAVGWISSRKHTLAVIFILLTLLSYLKNKKITSATFIYFALSILSHQMFVLFPLWLVLYIHFKDEKKDWPKLIGLMTLAAFVLFLGTFKTFYLGMGNVTYRDYSVIENISRYILSVGRSFTLVMLPASIAGAYFQGSIWNIIGLPLFVGSLFLFYKSKNKADPLLWITLAGFGHILTIIAFVNDTYLYLPLICFIIAMNYLFRAHPLKLPRKLQLTVAALVVALLGWKTVDASQMWKSDLALWNYSYENEESPFNAILLGSHLLPHDEKLALGFLEWGGKNFDLVSHKPILFYFLNTIMGSSLTASEKIRILREAQVDHEIYNSYFGLALLEGDTLQTREGLELLKKNLQAEEKYSPGTEGRLVIKTIRDLCRRKTNKQYVCQELSIRL